MATVERHGTIDWPIWESPSFWAQDLEVIVAQMAAQRCEAPVLWYEPAGSWVLANGGFWVLSKWEDQRHMESSPDFTTSLGVMIGDSNDPARIIDQLPSWAAEELAQPGLTPGERRGIVMRAKMSIGGRKGTESFNVLDPPEHTEIRGIFMKALRPSRVRKLPGFITELVDECLDKIEIGATVDIVPTLSRPVPPALMCEMIGVPRDMWGSFSEWADAVLMLMGVVPDRDKDEVAHLRGLERQYADYIEALLQERHGSDGGDGEDMFSVLAHSELHGRPIETAELIRQVNALISGGSHTSGNLITFLMYALAVHPEQLAVLHEHPELIGNAVEETLRYYPIVWTSGRTALRDVEIRGTTIREGDFALSSYVSANRDEDVWERPDEFDITRSFDAGHLAFGYGPHACPGGQLARVEVSTVLERVLQRYKSWKLGGDPVWLPSQFLNGIGSLPLVFEK